MQPRSIGVAAAALAMIAVGTSVTVSTDLVAYPVFSAQAVRYAIAALILGLGAVALRRSIPIPRGRDVLWLVALAATGLVLFNVAVVQAVSTSEPAAVAVLIGSVPLVLLLAESIRTRRRPNAALVLGVVLVVGGAALVQGGGKTTMPGMAWATVALACEAAFTLLAIPVLGRLGPVGVSIHTCWIAAVMLVILAVLSGGSNAFPPMSASEVVAIAYLAIVVTAIAFVLWYTAVGRIGPATAGLFAGLIPISAAIAGIIPGLTTMTPAVLGGAAIVGVGIAIGLAASQDRRGRRGDAV